MRKVSILARSDLRIAGPACRLDYRPDVLIMVACARPAARAWREDISGALAALRAANARLREVIEVKDAQLAAAGAALAARTARSTSTPVPAIRSCPAAVAEADGNRTRRRRSAPSTGFEDRGGHQAPRRLRVDSTAAVRPTRPP